MRVSLPCTPFTWEEALDFIRDRIGKKKAVILPEECRQAAAGKTKAAKPVSTHQLTFEEVAAEFGGPEEETPPADTAQEQESDFTSLADVLQEIKQSENA